MLEDCKVSLKIDFDTMGSNRCLPVAFMPQHGKHAACQNMALLQYDCVCKVCSNDSCSTSSALELLGVMMQSSMIQQKQMPSECCFSANYNNSGSTAVKHCAQGTALQSRDTRLPDD